MAIHANRGGQRPADDAADREPRRAGAAAAAGGAAARRRPAPWTVYGRSSAGSAAGGAPRRPRSGSSCPAAGGSAAASGRRGTREGCRGRGRRPWGRCIVASPVTARFTIGVDLGGTKLLAGAVGPDLSVHHRARRPALGLDQAGLVEMCVEAVEEARDAVDGEVVRRRLRDPLPDRPADRHRGRWRSTCRSHDIAFRDVMAERLGLPVTVDNDANCAALAEARAGAGEGATELIMLTIGTGIGSGIVIGGNLYRGAHGAAAEIGHMVVDLDGPPCQGFCPNRGCLEAVASGTALVRAAALAVAGRPDTALGRALEDGHPLTGPLITELAYDGDPVARDCVTLVGTKLGVGLANVVNIFNPEVVVIGGGVIAAGEMLLEPARAELRAAGAVAVQGVRPRRRRRLRRGVRDDRRLAAGARGGAGVTGPGGWSSARRRSATSRTSPCGCSPRCATPTSSRARTPGARACCSSATACRRRSSPTTSTTSASAPPSSCGGWPTARWWRW